MSFTVKSGSVSLKIKPWTNAKGQQWHRAEYYGPDGKRKHITGSTLAKAKDKAFKKAQELSKGTLDLASLAPHQVRAIRRMLDADPQLSLVDDFLAWKAKVLPEKLLADAADEFLALKLLNRGKSIQNYGTLTKMLKRLKAAFAGRFLSDITLSELDAFVAGKETHKARTRRNNRSGLITFFRWCREREFLPDVKTLAEKTEKPHVGRKIPETYEPDEMALMLASVRPKFLPWLASGGFASVRTDEIYPLSGGDKSPLDWSDFKWERGIIIVRPETDKNGQRRVIPIQPVLREWLYPVRKESGPIGGGISDPSKGREPETVRLGQLIGGWRRNGLRHSSISYRVAAVGFAKAAAEAGNSEAETKKSYHDAKSEADAKRWFTCGRKRAAQVLKSSQLSPRSALG